MAYDLVTWALFTNLASNFVEIFSKDRRHQRLRQGP